MMNDEMTYRTLPSFSLMLHGWSECFPAEKLLSLFEKYFQFAKVEPQAGDVQGVAPSSLKHLSMPTIRKRITSKEIHGLNSLGTYHFVDRKYKPSHDYFLNCEMTNGNHLVQFVNAVSAEKERYKLALDFLREAIEHLTPNYGYSLEMPLGDDPALFATGHFVANKRNLEEVLAWQNASDSTLGGQAHKQGRMRHVFAINILSRPHMEAKIDGRTFGEWVKNQNRGVIEEWKDGVWVWQVPKANRQKIAAVLHFNGILTTPEGFQNFLIG